MQRAMLAGRYAGKPSTPMGESNAALGRFPDLVNFGLGDPDVPTDPRIVEATFEDVRAGATHYTDAFGMPELREEIARFHAEEYGEQVTTDEIFVTTSACHGMWLTMEAILDPGDEVVIVEPYFTPYPSQIRLAGGTPVVVATREADHFQIDPAVLDTAVTGRTKAVVLNTPGNPTGHCLTRETQRAVADIAQAHDLVVVADDIYTTLSYARPFEPFSTLPGMRERTVTLRSLSKDFAMTGWRIGWIVAPRETVVGLRDINENVVFSAPAPSQRAALHALRLRSQVQPPLRALYERRITHAAARVNRVPWMSCLEPEGTIYLFVNVSAAGRPCAEVARRLLEEAHVLTIPGTAFGTGCEGFLRLAVTVSEEAIDDAFDRIERLDPSTW